MRTKEEYKVGTLTTIKDNFRAYASDEEGVRGYYDFIATSRYANLKTASTPEEYARMLKADGYATSSSYVNTLISTVNKYDLRRFDPVRTSVGKTYPILKKGSRGDDVRVKMVKNIFKSVFIMSTDFLLRVGKSMALRC